MKLVKYLIVLLIFLSSTGLAYACVVPTDGMTITESTTLCQGVYDLPNGIILGASGVTLDCDGATLEGGWSEEINMWGYGVNISNLNLVTLKNCNINDYFRAILMEYSNNLIIENNQLLPISGNTALSLKSVTNSLIKNNRIFGTTYVNWDSYDNVFFNNAHTDGQQNGVIYFNSASHNNTIKQSYFLDIITGYGDGVNLQHGSYENIIEDNQFNNVKRSIILVGSNDNIIRNNNINLPWRGVVIADPSTNGNVIYNNSISDATETCIYVGETPNNTIYNNNLINCPTYIYDEKDTLWGTVTTGGNYYDIYDEVAEGCLDDNTDGVCDSPYVIDADSQDKYPFVSPSGWLTYVPPTPQPPTIDSYSPESPITINELDSIEFTHTSSDINLDPLTYSWKLDGVEQVTTQNWTYLTDYESAGEHIINLRVSDGSFEVYQSWIVTVNNVIPTEVRCNEIYDDFSGSSLDLTKWEEAQDPQGQPLTNEHFVDINLNNYHVANTDIQDKRTVLKLTNYTFQSGKILEYDVDYISGSGNRANVIFVNNQPLDVYLGSLGCNWCGSIGFNGQEFDIGNQFGVYHVKLEFLDNGFNLIVTRPDNSIYNKFVPFTLPINLGFETWSNGAIHSDYDNFRLCEINYQPQIESYLPIENQVTIDEGSYITFSQISSDLNNDTLTYSWKLDGVEQSTEQDWVFTTDSNSAGTYVVSLVVSDGSMNAMENWDVTINDVAEPSPPSSGGGGGGSGGGGRRITPVTETTVPVPTTPKEAAETETTEGEKSGMEGITGGVIGTEEDKENIVLRAFKSIGRVVVSVFEGIGRFFKWVF